MSAISIQNVIDAIPESIIIIDLDGNIIACNSTLADRLYKSPSSLVGKSVFDLLPPELAEQRKKYVEQSISTQSNIRFRDNRHGRWIDNTITRICNDDGHVTSLIIHGVDITDEIYQVDIPDEIYQKEKLQEVEQDLEIFISNLPGFAYRCKNDADWTMEFMSEGTYELTGYHAQDLLNNATLSYVDLIHVDDRAMVREMTQHAIELKQNYRYSYRIRTADNQEKWVYEDGKGVFDGHGNLQALEGFVLSTYPHKYKSNQS